MFARTSVPVLMAFGCFVAIVAAHTAAAQEYCGASDWARVVDISGDAKALLDAGKYDDALAALKRAYSLCPDPRLHRSIGKVYLAAGRDSLALSEFEACLVSDAGMDVHAECGELAKEATRMIESTSIVLDGTPAGAVVAVDGAVVSPGGGGDVKVAPGVHDVEITLEGYRSFNTRTTVERGRATPVTVDMPLLATAPESLPGPEADEVADAGREVDVTVSSEAPSSAVAGGRASAFDPVTVPNWVGIGLGVAAIGVGVGFLAQYGLDLKDVEENPFEEGEGGYWPREVGITNVAVGASFAAAGVVAVVLSAALWPDAKVTPVIAAAPGGGVVGITVGL